MRFAMPIMEFENRREAPLVLVVEPWGDRHEIPHLSSAAIQYVLKEGAEDRCFSTVSDIGIDFWCNAESYQIEIVHPPACDRLSWDICVNGGWCGGIVDGKPTRVDDLLPATGSLSAEEFARLVIRADGWPESEAFPDKHLRWLEAKFIEHLGARSVDVEVLRQTRVRPFDDAPLTP